MISNGGPLDSNLGFKALSILTERDSTLVAAFDLTIQQLQLLLTNLLLLEDKWSIKHLSPSAPLKLVEPIHVWLCFRIDHPDLRLASAQNHSFGLLSIRKNQLLEWSVQNHRMPLYLQA